MFRYYIFLLFFSGAISVHAQSWQWGKTYGGSGSEFANGITTDNFGNVYSACDFRSTSATIGSQLITNHGMGDILIVKYRSNGVLCWAKCIGGTQLEAPYAMTCDPSGNLYVSGDFQGTVNFGPDTLVSAGNRDIFLAKFDSLGNCIWAKGMGSATGSENAEGLVYSPLDNTIVLAGDFYSTSSFVDTVLTSVGGCDIFISKWSLSGQRLMLRGYGTTGTDATAGADLDPSGNIYISTLISSQAGIMKTSPAGSILWSVQATGAGVSSPQGIVFNNSGNVTISGFYNSYAVSFSNITLPAGANWNSFIAQYDANGNVRWAREVSSTNSSSYGCEIDADASGNIFFDTYFTYDIYTDTTIVLTQGPNLDAIIYKFSNNGELMWKKLLNGVGTEAIGHAHFSNGAVYINGYLNGNATYGSINLSTTSLDVLILKLSDCSPMASTVIQGLPGVNNIVCDGDIVQLQSSFTAPGYAYQWTSYGYPITGAISSAYSPVSDGVFSIELTDPAGCTFTSAYVGVTFAPHPDSTLTRTNHGPCQVDSVEFATVSQGPCTYQWLRNGLPIVGATAQNYMATLAGNYRVIITSLFGCFDTSAVYPVLLGTFPNIVVSNDTSICYGASVQLFVSGASQYAWIPSSSLSSSTSASPVATPAVSTSYIVTGTTSLCSAIDTIHVIVNPQPSPALQIFFQTNALLANYANGIQWYLSNLAIPGANGQMYWYTQNGLYHFTYTDSLGCVWTSGSYNVIDVSIGQINNNGSQFLKVTPNPFSGKTFIEFNKAEVIEFHIYTVTGEEVTSYQTHLTGDGFELDMSGLSAGLYYASFYTKHGMQVVKLVLK